MIKEWFCKEKQTTEKRSGEGGYLTPMRRVPEGFYTSTGRNPRDEEEEEKDKVGQMKVKEKLQGGKKGGKIIWGAREN